MGRRIVVRGDGASCAGRATPLVAALGAVGAVAGTVPDAALVARGVVENGMLTPRSFASPTEPVALGASVVHGRRH